MPAAHVMPKRPWYLAKCAISAWITLTVIAVLFVVGAVLCTIH